MSCVQCSCAGVATAPDSELSLQKTKKPSATAAKAEALQVPPHVVRRILEMLILILAHSKNRVAIHTFLSGTSEIDVQSGASKILGLVIKREQVAKGKRPANPLPAAAKQKAGSQDPMTAVGILVSLLSNVVFLRSGPLMEHLLKVLATVCNGINGERAHAPQEQSTPARNRLPGVAVPLLADMSPVPQQNSDAATPTSASGAAHASSGLAPSTSSRPLISRRGLESLVTIFALETCSDSAFSTARSVIEQISTDERHVTCLFDVLTACCVKHSTELSSDLALLATQASQMGSADKAGKADSGLVDSVDRPEALDKLSAKASPQVALLRTLKVILAVCSRLGKALVTSQKETAEQKKSQDAAAATKSTAAAAASRTNDAATGSVAANAAEGDRMDTEASPVAADLAAGAAESVLSDADALGTVWKQFPLSSSDALATAWQCLSTCLDALLARTHTKQMVTVLSPAIECLFVYTQITQPGGVEKKLAKEDAPSSSSRSAASPEPAAVGSGEASSNLDPESSSFTTFIEKFQSVINDIIRATPAKLSSGPFSILVQHAHVLDFRVKEAYFRQQLKKEAHGHRHGRFRMEVRREDIFLDSYRHLHKQNLREQLMGKIDVKFAGEEGVDAGGLLREWYYKLSHEMMNPNYGLFIQSNIGSETYQPNPNSNINPNHLSYFEFCGRICAKAIYDNQLLDCHFTRAFYKQILGKPVSWHDMQAVDEEQHKSLLWILSNSVEGLEMTMAMDTEKFGLVETRDLVKDGQNVAVTNDNKNLYVDLICNVKLVEAIKPQMEAFLKVRGCFPALLMPSQCWGGSLPCVSAAGNRPSRVPVREVHCQRSQKATMFAAPCLQLACLLFFGATGLPRADPAEGRRNLQRKRTGIFGVPPCLCRFGSMHHVHLSLASANVQGCHSRVVSCLTLRRLNADAGNDHQRAA